MLGLGPPEIGLILVLALILFGPKRLPELGRSIGKAMKEFRKATSEVEEQIKKEVGDLEKTVNPIKSTVEEVREEVKKAAKTTSGN